MVKTVEVKNLPKKSKYFEEDKLCRVSDLVQVLQFRKGASALKSRLAYPDPVFKMWSDPDPVGRFKFHLKLIFVEVLIKSNTVLKSQLY